VFEPNYWGVGIPIWYCLVRSSHCTTLVNAPGTGAAENTFRVSFESYYRFIEKGRREHIVMGRPMKVFASSLGQDEIKVTRSPDVVVMTKVPDS
jgi:hypothetical protein